MVVVVYQDRLVVPHYSVDVQQLVSTWLEFVKLSAPHSMWESISKLQWLL